MMPQGGRSWQPFGEGKEAHKKIRQARNCYFHLTPSLSKFRRSNNWKTHWEFTYLGKVKAIVWLCIGFIGSPWRPPTRLNYFSSTSSWMAVYKGMYKIDGCISMKVFQLLLCLLFEGVPLLIKVPQQNPVNFELKRNWNFNSSAI